MAAWTGYSGVGFRKERTITTFEKSTRKSSRVTEKQPFVYLHFYQFFYYFTFKSPARPVDDLFVKSKEMESLSHDASESGLSRRRSNTKKIPYIFEQP